MEVSAPGLKERQEGMGVGGARSLSDGKKTGYRRAVSGPSQWGQKDDNLRLAEFERLVGHLEAESSRKLCVVGAMLRGGTKGPEQNKKGESLSCMGRSPWESWGASGR